MKVNINSAHHQVEIECDAQDLSYVLDKARQLFDATHPDTRVSARPYGFAPDSTPSPAIARP